MREEFLANVGAKWDAMIRGMKEKIKGKERKEEDGDSEIREYIDDLNKEGEKRDRERAAKELREGGFDVKVDPQTEPRKRKKRDLMFVDLDESDSDSGIEMIETTPVVKGRKRPKPATVPRTAKESRKVAVESLLDLRNASQDTLQIAMRSMENKVALKVMKSFCSMAERGKFRNLRVLKFEEVSLINTASLRLREALSSENTPKLETVEFVECDLREHEIKFLRPALNGLDETLEHLVLKNNEFGDAVTASLLEALKAMPHLRTLVIHEEGFGERTENKVEQLVEIEGKEVLEVTGFEDGRREERVEELLGKLFEREESIYHVQMGGLKMTVSGRRRPEQGEEACAACGEYVGRVRCKECGYEFCGECAIDLYH